MFELEHVCFPFIISKCQKFTLMTETEAERILKHAWCHSWEVLVDRVRWDVAQLESILLPLRAVGEELGRVVELQVSDRRCQVHQSLEWSIIEQLSLPIDMEQINCAHLTTTCQ